MWKLSNRKSAALNSSSNILAQAITALFSFVSRIFFLKYLGVELLGLNSTFSAIIAIASLAETGLGTCIIYRLYAKLQSEDEDGINELINIARVYLSTIGISIIVISILCTPFLKYVITGMAVDINVTIYFLLQVLATAFTYFLSYKRLLLTADKKDFVGKFADSVCNIIFSLLKILVCIYTQNYYLYLLLSWANVVLANGIIHILCRKIYPFLKAQKVRISLLKEMWPDMKNLFWGGAAAYLFSATDNLILSVGVSTVLVGYLGNYTAITSTLKMFILNLLLFMGPIIGNQVVSKYADQNKTNDYLRFYDFGLYLVSAVLLIPESILIQDFINNVFGKQYILGNEIVALIVADQYITIVQDCNGVFLSVTGKFRELKIADGVAAVLNIGLSIVLCWKMGLFGILLGTVISRIIQWIIKVHFARKDAIMRNDNKIFRYTIRTFVKASLFIILLLIVHIIYSTIAVDNFYIRFVVGGILGVTVSGGLVLLAGMANGDTELAYSFIKKNDTQINIKTDK